LKKQLKFAVNKEDKIMKKTTLLAVLFALVLGSFAQKNFQLGLHLSPNIGWIKPDGSNIEGDGAKLGYSFGVIADFNISDNYILSTGVHLLSTGFTLIKPDIQTFTDNSGSEVIGYGKTVSDIRLNYVELPVTLKLRTNEIGYIKYYGKVGFGLGVNYDATADEEFSYTTSTTTGATLTNDAVDYDDEINLFRASLIIGGGIEYNLSGNTSLIAGVTFNNGLNNIFSKDVNKADGNGNASATLGDERSESAKSINNMILLNVGILF
jgi:hypothetical protein